MSRDCLSIVKFQEHLCYRKIHQKPCFVPIPSHANGLPLTAIVVDEAGMWYYWVIDKINSHSAYGYPSQRAAYEALKQRLQTI